MLNGAAVGWAEMGFDEKYEPSSTPRISTGPIIR
jgi:hypothetical protein